MRASRLLGSAIFVLAGCLWISLAGARDHHQHQLKSDPLGSSSGGRGHQLRHRADTAQAAAEDEDDKAIKKKRAAIAQRNCLNKEIINPAMPADKQQEAKEKIVLPFLTKCLSEMILSLSSKASFDQECCILDLFRLFDQCKSLATTPRPSGSDGESTTTTTTMSPASKSTTKMSKKHRHSKTMKGKKDDHDDDDKKDKKDHSTSTTSTTKKPHNKKNKKKEDDDDERR